MTYGCHNRKPLRKWRNVQEGWNPLGTQRLVLTVDPMTKDCQYTHTKLGQADPKCEGCKWRAEKP
ncbi:MAG: hypothetical protein K0Q92_656 [Steroidobacteraceae bacterium]|jgi:hypothetical protein|nr:hypothetical protein [Steroidobacteraceae bacterium]